MATSASIPNMPGFVRVYAPSHGFLGRHVFNPSTGEALSERQARAVINGQQSLQQALMRTAVPRRTQRQRSFHNKLYRVRTFSTIYGLWRYAGVRGMGNLMFVTAYGIVRKLYQNESNPTYRTISPFADRSWFAKQPSIFVLYKDFDDLFEMPYQQPAYFLWEPLE